MFDLDTLNGLFGDAVTVADGRVTPVVDRVFAFDELPAAKAYMESNAMVGKVVVKVAS